jgi:membrane protease subunit (stomatin/prohibitin family)
MGIFNKKKNGGFSDVIRCDEPNFLIWRWHPNGFASGDLKRDTAIRTGSVLRVKTGEVAVFVYKQHDGQSEDYIVGPYDGTLKTKNFPVLSSIIGLWYEGDTPFQAEVYFVNLATVIQIRFGVPYFGVVDPRYPDFEVPVAVRGTLSFKINDYKAFEKCHRLIDFDLEEFKQQVSDAICRYVKDAVAKAPAENGIPVVAIESKIDLITDKAELLVKDRLADTFGVSVTGLDISAIEIDKESEVYQELKRITKGIETKRAEANITDYEEKLRIEREEKQYAQHMETRQGNLGAFQTEAQRDVGVAGAQALGKMGENGAGNVDIGGGGGGGAGFNPVSIMAGVALGGAVGKNIAGTMDTALSGANPAGANPPPVPTVKYNVAKNGKPTGPYEISKLGEMAASGELLPDSLVWKAGMSEWGRADAQSELKPLFPPAIK